MLTSMRSLRVGHNLATKQQQTYTYTHTHIYIYTMEYVIKKNKICHLQQQMDLGIIILSEAVKHKCFMVSLICEV